MRWDTFAQLRPEMASAGEALFRAFTIGYLATVRRDGHPRVHPVSIALQDGGLFCTILPDTRKAADLRRDGRYSLHAFPRLPTSESWVDEEFMVGGIATETDDPETRAAILGGVAAAASATEAVYELDVTFAFHKARDAGLAVINSVFVAPAGQPRARPLRNRNEEHS